MFEENAITSSRGERVRTVLLEVILITIEDPWVLLTDFHSEDTGRGAHQDPQVLICVTGKPPADLVFSRPSLQVGLQRNQRLAARRVNREGRPAPREVFQGSLHEWSISALHNASIAESRLHPADSSGILLDKGTEPVVAGGSLRGSALPRCAPSFQPRSPFELVSSPIPTPPNVQSEAISFSSRQ